MKKYLVVDRKKQRLGRFEIVLDTVREGNTLHPYSYVSMKDSVGVLAFAGDKLVLIRQYRHSLDCEQLEIAGGGVEKGELPVDTARRELEEETGYVAESLEELGKYYPSPGSTDETCTLFLARCGAKGKKRTEPLEYAETVLLDEAQFVSLIKDGSFRHSMGLVAWLYYKNGKGEELC